MRIVQAKLTGASHGRYSMRAQVQGIDFGCRGLKTTSAAGCTGISLNVDRALAGAPEEKPS